MRHLLRLKSFITNPGNGIDIFSRTEYNSLSSASALATAQPPLDPVKNRSDRQHARQSSYHLLVGHCAIYFFTLLRLNSAIHLLTFLRIQMT